MKDGYFKDSNNEVIDFLGSEKIGSKNYLFVMYPYIEIKNGRRVFRWFILFYDDPNKENSDISKIIKSVLKQIFNITFHHLTINSVIDSLHDVLQSVSIIIYTIQTEDDEKFLHDLEPKTYSIKCQRKQEYLNVPKNKIREFISNFVPKKNATKKAVIKIKEGHRLIKIDKQEKREFENSINEKVEEYFNYKITVGQKDVDEGCIYKTNFVIEKMGEVLKNYFSTL